MNEKILIVDDEKEIADLIEVYLKNDGYDVYKFYPGIWTPASPSGSPIRRTAGCL